jgi:hypothetical protein
VSFFEGTIATMDPHISYTAERTPFANGGYSYQIRMPNGLLMGSLSVEPDGATTVLRSGYLHPTDIDDYLTFFRVLAPHLATLPIAGEVPPWFAEWLAVSPRSEPGGVLRIPVMPGKHEPRERWFEYYLACTNAGFTPRQKQLAKEMDISHGHFRTEYGKWFAEHKPDEEAK